MKGEGDKWGREREAGRGREWGLERWVRGEGGMERRKEGRERGRGRNAEVGKE